MNKAKVTLDETQHINERMVLTIEFTSGTSFDGQALTTGYELQDAINSCNGYVESKYYVGTRSARIKSGAVTFYQVETA